MATAAAGADRFNAAMASEGAAGGGGDLGMTGKEMLDAMRRQALPVHLLSYSVTNACSTVPSAALACSRAARWHSSENSATFFVVILALHSYSPSQSVEKSPHAPSPLRFFEPVNSTCHGQTFEG